MPRQASSGIIRQELIGEKLLADDNHTTTASYNATTVVPFSVQQPKYSKFSRVSDFL